MLLKLQQRDVDILRFVYAHRAVSFSQVWKKFFSGKAKSTVSMRLLGLCKDGYLDQGLHYTNGKYAQRYFMPRENLYGLVRHHWGFELDKPLYRSDSVMHDLRAVDIAVRFEKLSQFQKLLTENVLQSSSALLDDPNFGGLVRLNADGALVVSGKSGRSYLFGLEVEVSKKSPERYKSKLNAYYLTSGIQGVIYVYSDETIRTLLAKADSEIRKDKKSLLHFVSESDALSNLEKITVFNAKEGSFDLK